MQSPLVPADVKCDPARWEPAAAALRTPEPGALRPAVSEKRAVPAMLARRLGVGT